MKLHKDYDASKLRQRHNILRSLGSLRQLSGALGPLKRSGRGVVPTLVLQVLGLLAGGV